MNSSPNRGYVNNCSPNFSITVYMNSLYNTKFLCDQKLSDQNLCEQNLGDQNLCEQYFI